MNGIKHVEYGCSNPSFSLVPLSLQTDRSDDKDNGLSWKPYHRLQWWFKAVAVHTCAHTGLLTFASQKSTYSCPLVPFVSYPALFVFLFPFVCPRVSTQFHVSWAPSVSWFSFRLHIRVTYLQMLFLAFHNCVTFFALCFSDRMTTARNESLALWPIAPPFVPSRRFSFGLHT